MTGRLRGRAGLWMVGAVVFVCALAGGARADKKKEPGFFDLKSWIPGSHERDAVRRLTPDGVNLAPAVEREGEARVIRVRVYADKDYRSTTLRWHAQTRAQIQRLNAVIGPVFNARFEIESLRDWDKSHVGAPLNDAILAELEALDDGAQVDLVVGMITPLKGVATSAHHIGGAAYLSRHIVLRGMDDEQEFRSFEREFKLITGEERQRLYADRKAHKEIVIFLHEWGHALGLLHREEVKDIMNPRYDPQQSEFSEYEKRILALVIERRLAARDTPNPESADLLPLVAAMPEDEGSDADRARLLELVRRRAAPGRASRSTPASAVDLPPADIKAFNKALETFNAGHAPEAWTTLAPVVARARARKVDAATWLRIADLEVAIGALTEADEAAGYAGRSPAAQKIAARIESTRHQIALPLDSRQIGVPPEREPAYVAGYWETVKAIDGADIAEARARLGELAAAFPATPGVEVLTCDLEWRAKRAALATKHCEAALEKFKGATRAHVLLAAIAFGARKGPVAEQHLRQAILLDPADPTCWRALAHFYRSTGASKRLAALANEHQQLLASPLPE